MTRIDKAAFLEKLDKFEEMPIYSRRNVKNLIKLTRALLLEFPSKDEAEEPEETDSQSAKADSGKMQLTLVPRTII